MSPIAKSGFLRRAWDRLNHASHASNPLVGLNVGSETEFDTVDSRCPSHQNAIDAVPGWNHAFPAEYGVEAGPNVMFNDPRIHWAIEQFGGIAGRRVLEVGPLEGSHTFMLDRADPAILDAVEVNQRAYLRCLIAKEIYGLRHARFYLGSVLPWLENGDRAYDLIIACGVLYHLQEPLRALELMARQADALYLWTHYFDDVAMPPDDLRSLAFLKSVNIEKRGGLEIKLHARSYYGAWRNDTFCGGPKDLHYWMEKPDILNYLAALGLDDIRVAHDDPRHVNGPSVSIFAKRSQPKAP